VVAQQAVPVLEGDTEETLHERIKEVERRLYPDAIRKVITELEESNELREAAR
jgi:phosphoribosylglycinamide formyltransferase 1